MHQQCLFIAYSMEQTTKLFNKTIIQFRHKNNIFMIGLNYSTKYPKAVNLNIQTNSGSPTAKALECPFYVLLNLASRRLSVCPSVFEVFFLFLLQQEENWVERCWYLCRPLINVAMFFVFFCFCISAFLFELSYVNSSTLFLSLPSFHSDKSTTSNK